MGYLTRIRVAVSSNGFSVLPYVIHQRSVSRFQKSLAKWDSNAVVPLVLILPLLVALGISQMPTELVNPKSSWSTSSLKVSPKSSAGNKNWKPEKILKTKSPTPVFQPNTKKKLEILQI